MSRSEEPRSGPPREGAARDEPWRRLEELEPFFAALSNPAPQSVQERFDSLRQVHGLLRRTQRQVTFVGAFKSGKSSLLNALLGAPLLPVRANRATGVVTVVRHSTGLSAHAVRTGGDRVEVPIPIQDMPQEVLLDLSHGVVRPPADVDEVRIQAPLALPLGNWVLVDTPGLFEQDDLSVRVFREIERSDLVVLVLSADKVLSARERDVARYVHRLLNGNVVYVLNRIDLVDVEGQTEVLDWARGALTGSGNALVGSPSVFVTAAGPDAACHDLSGFPDWLVQVMATPLGDRIALLSRLGVLEAQLREIQEALKSGLGEAQEEVQVAHRAAAASLDQQRSEIKQRIARSREKLSAWKSELPGMGETFVEQCVEATRAHLRDRDRPEAAIQISFDEALQRYVDAVSEDVLAAVVEAPVTVPRFDLKGWIVRAEVAPATHLTSELGASFGELMTRVVDGGSAGREAGAAIGSWIGKNLFGVDVERDTLRRIEGTAGATADSLQIEAERYVEGVDALLAQAAEYYESWSGPEPAQVREAGQRERIQAALLRWCESFLETAERISQSAVADAS